LTFTKPLPGEKECKNSGLFTGKGFSKCQISVQDEVNDENPYSYDTLIKYSGNLFVDEISDDYKDEIIDLNNDFKFTNVTNNKASGTWTYDSDNVESPDIRFWLAKAGSGNSNSGFILFWQVDDIAIDNGDCIAGESSSSNSSFDCMSLAKSVTTGTWVTPNDKNLSHITYFGGLCKDDETRAGCDTTTAAQAVPEPSSIALFSLALFGIVTQRKKLTR
jgi:hypothetical protein